MTFSARKAVKSALWIFPLALVLLAFVDLAFNQFDLSAVDWRQWIAKAVLLTAVLSILSGRSPAQ